MAIVLCAAACFTPFFNRVGEQYFVIAVIILLSGILIISQLSLLRSDWLLAGVFVYVLIVAVIQGSLHTPITLWRWAAAGIAFFCGRLFIKEQSLFAGVLMVPAFVQMVFVILQRVGVLQSLSFFFPVSGTFGNPAQAAVLIAMGFAASLEIINEKWAALRYGERIILIGLALLFLIALLLCNTRSCWLASIAVAAYLFFGSRLTKKKDAVDHLGGNPSCYSSILLSDGIGQCQIADLEGQLVSFRESSCLRWRINLLCDRLYASPGNLFY